MLKVCERLDFHTARSVKLVDSMALRVSQEIQHQVELLALVKDNVEPSDFAASVEKHQATVHGISLAGPAARKQTVTNWDQTARCPAWGGT